MIRNGPDYRNPDTGFSANNKIWLVYSSVLSPVSAPITALSKQEDLRVMKRGSAAAVDSNEESESPGRTAVVCMKTSSGRRVEETDPGKKIGSKTKFSH